MVCKYTMNCVSLLFLVRGQHLPNDNRADFPGVILLWDSFFCSPNLVFTSSILKKKCFYVSFLSFFSVAFCFFFFYFSVYRVCIGSLIGWCHLRFHDGNDFGLSHNGLHLATWPKWLLTAKNHLTPTKPQNKNGSNTHSPGKMRRFPDNKCVPCSWPNGAIKSMCVIYGDRHAYKIQCQQATSNEHKMYKNVHFRQDRYTSTIWAFELSTQPFENATPKMHSA